MRRDEQIQTSPLRGRHSRNSGPGLASAHSRQSVDQGQEKQETIAFRRPGTLAGAVGFEPTKRSDTSDRYRGGCDKPTPPNSATDARAHPRFDGDREQATTARHSRSGRNRHRRHASQGQPCSSRTNTRHRTRPVRNYSYRSNVGVISTYGKCTFQWKPPRHPLLADPLTRSTEPALQKRCNARLPTAQRFSRSPGAADTVHSCWCRGRVRAFPTPRG